MNEFLSLICLVIDMQIFLYCVHFSFARSTLVFMSVTFFTVTEFTGGLQTVSQSLSIEHAL